MMEIILGIVLLVVIIAILFFVYQPEEESGYSDKNNNSNTKSRLVATPVKTKPYQKSNYVDYIDYLKPDGALNDMSLRNLMSTGNIPTSGIGQENLSYQEIADQSFEQGVEINQVKKPIEIPKAEPLGTNPFVYTGPLEADLDQPFTWGKIGMPANVGPSYGESMKVY